MMDTVSGDPAAENSSAENQITERRMTEKPSAYNQLMENQTTGDRSTEKQLMENQTTGDRSAEKQLMENQMTGDRSAEKQLMENQSAESRGTDRHPSRHIVDYNLMEEMQHGFYVSNLAYALAKELGQTEHLRDLAIAGVLHDVGKLQLNHYVYGDRNTLVIEEMKYVRMHPNLSYEILREKGYADYVLQSVRHHHENYDGSGYPDNLVGEGIPEGARILRVCDVFAALTSNRPYRRSFEMEASIELMIDEVKNFDMKVFLAFQRIVHTDEIRELVQHHYELDMSKEGAILS